jgi:hypothetical protein
MKTSVFKGVKIFSPQQFHFHVLVLNPSALAFSETARFSCFDALSVPPCAA